MVVLQHRQSSCSSGYSSWTCLESSTQQAFNGCCKSDPCLNGGVCPDDAQECDMSAGYQRWVCQKTLTQTAYNGCCKIDACANGGSCPASALPPGSNIASSSSTQTAKPSTRTISASNTDVIVFHGTSASATLLTDSSYSYSSQTIVTTDGGSVYTTVMVQTVLISVPVTVTIASPSATGLSSPNPTSSPDSKSAIIGGAVGGIVALISLLIIAVCFCRHKRKAYEAGYSEKPSGILSILSFRHNDDDRNSMTDPIPKQSFLASLIPFRKRPFSPISAQRDLKVPSPPLGFTEMPSPSFPPPASNIDLPYDRAELESDTVTAPSELTASTPLQGNRGSGSSAWGPTPEPRSDASNTSTTAVVSPMRETYYSDASSSDYITNSSLSKRQPPLEIPIMRSNLHSLRKPTPDRQSQSQGQSSGPSASGSGEAKHVMSFMEFEGKGGAGTGSGRAD